MTATNLWLHRYKFKDFYAVATLVSGEKGMVFDDD